MRPFFVVAYITFQVFCAVFVIWVLTLYADYSIPMLVTQSFLVILFFALIEVQQWITGKMNGSMFIQTSWSTFTAEIFLGISLQKQERIKGEAVHWAMSLLLGGLAAFCLLWFDVQPKATSFVLLTLAVTLVQAIHLIWILFDSMFRNGKAASRKSS